RGGARPGHVLGASVADGGRHQRPRAGHVSGGGDVAGPPLGRWGHVRAERAGDERRVRDPVHVPVQMVVTGGRAGVLDTLERFRSGWERLDAGAVLATFAERDDVVVFGT